MLLFLEHRHSTDREVALMMLMAYLSYMLAEVLKLFVIINSFISSSTFSFIPHVAFLCCGCPLGFLIFLFFFGGVVGKNDGDYERGTNSRH